MSKVLIKRHVAKSISYRFVGTLQTVILGYLFTGSFKIASTIGAIELGIKPLLYFLHERVWYKWIKFGIVVDNPKKKLKKEVVESPLVESTLLTGLPEETQNKIKRLSYTKRTD
jgi:uncharacterized membrane protein